MPLRIAVGGFLHETNTFVTQATTWADFERDGAWPGAKTGRDIFTYLDGLNLAIAGFMDEARKGGHEFVPTAWAMAMPGGRVSDNAFERMSAQLLTGISKADADVVFLELHGAMVTESHDDAEAELLRRVRDVVDPQVPIVCTLDLHANVSAELVRHASLLQSYRTYPHVDWGDSGRRVANWLDEVVQWGEGHGRAFRQLPFLIPITSGSTFIEPSRRLYARIAEIEDETGASLSLNMGFPPADIPDVGPSITAFAQTQSAADKAAEILFREVLAAEAEYAANNPLQAPDAIATAKSLSAVSSRPVILADTQDNPGAGSPSNTTGLIAEALRQGAEGVLVGNFYDPDAAMSATARGIGSSLDTLGGRGEGPGQEPLPGPWRIVALSDGSYRGLGPMLRSRSATLGPTALLEKDGVRVLVVSIRQQPVHLEVFSHIGADPLAAHILILKSSAHFRAAYQPIAERVIVALSPGLNLEDPSQYRFTKVRPGLRLNPSPA